ncbi:MAG: hypothetical protein ACTSUS_02590 [Candidatus Freyarchaeota archaeon]
MVSKRRTIRGQMRVIEAILASFIVVFAFSFVNTFNVTPSSARYEVGELERVGYNVLRHLDEHGLLGRLVYDEEWQNLTAILTVLLPSDVHFNLTVYRWVDERSQRRLEVVNEEPICYGETSSSDFVAHVTYVIPSYVNPNSVINPSYKVEYNPRVLILQLARK